MAPRIPQRPYSEVSKQQEALCRHCKSFLRGQTRTCHYTQCNLVSKPLMVPSNPVVSRLGKHLERHTMTERSGFMEKDGGYSWIVLVTIVLNNFVCMGFVFSTAGVFANEYPDLLSVDQSTANIVGSTLIGVFLISVPFNALLLAIVGCRILSTVGFVLILTGIVSSAFPSQLWHLIVGLSVVCGLGMSMNFTSTIGIIPHYFEKRKLAAYTAPGVGSGIAMVSFSYIVTSLLEVHAYKMTMLYLSPMFLLAATAPIIFKPQISTEIPASFVAALKHFFSPCKLFVTPFYLLNAYFWNGGHVSIMVLLFGYIVDRSQVSVAAFTYSLMGAGFLTGTLVLAVYLIKFSLNHFLLQICCHIVLAAATFTFAFANNIYAYYVFAFLNNMAYGMVIANMACLSVHLFPSSQVESAFSFQEAIGGIAGIVAPITAGLIQSRFGDTAGLCYVSAHGVLAALSLIIPAAIKTELWKPCSISQLNSASLHNVEAKSENNPDTSTGDV